MSPRELVVGSGERSGIPSAWSRCLPLVAHCHLGLGKLYRRTGKREAQEHVTTVTTMHREMGMAYWLDRATTEFKELA